MSSMVASAHPSLPAAPPPNPPPHALSCAPALVPTAPDAPDPPSWAQSAPVRAEGLGSLQRLDEELLHLLLCLLDARAMAALARCSSAFADPVARAAQAAAQRCGGLLQLPERRHGESWPRLLLRAERRAASRRAPTLLAAGHHTALALVAGGVHRSALGADGRGESWRVALPARLGGGGAARAVAVACGALHALVLLEDGRVLQLETPEGGPGGADAWLEAEGEAGEGIATVACGAFHSLLVGRKGGLWASGRNAFGQCGLGHFQPLASSAVAAAVVGLRPARALQADGGGHHSLVLTHGGTVFSFGCGNHGRLGLGDAWADQPTPQRVDVGQDVICQVAAGGDCSYALTELGHVLVLGGITLYSATPDTDSVYAQRQLGVPRRLHDFPGHVVVRQLSAGYDHTVALDSHGLVWSWGAAGVVAEASASGSVDSRALDSDDVQVVAHRLPRVGQLGSIAPGRLPLVIGSTADLSQAADLEPAQAEAFGRCTVVAAGGCFTVGWPVEDSERGSCQTRNAGVDAHEGPSRSTVRGTDLSSHTSTLNSEAWSDVRVEIANLTGSHSSRDDLERGLPVVEGTKRKSLTLLWAASPHPP
ncbi:hypothetical protein AB1Y20_023326 [Prymnesium parvum]|uniref:F-box domain-containing protein n=1 Tax=Prymnesium parvum TaxID=97485 RepID=A0AB34JG13_PRYPA